MKIEYYLTFILEGIVKYYIPQEENDLTFGFLSKKSICYPLQLSYYSEYFFLSNIDPDNTTLWRISYKYLQEVYAKTEGDHNIG